jgi:hypothetical protein
VRHQLLFAIRVEHAYYSGERCPALVVEPRPATRKLLAGRRLLAGARSDGLDVLAPVDAEDRPFITLENGLSLGFDLRPVDSDLLLFTDLAPFRAFSRPRLRNADGDALVLAEGEAPLARGALATIEIAGVDGAWTAAPPTFTVTLAPREARWIYYWVGGDSEISIVDDDPARSDAPIEFEAETATSEGDRIAEDLARRYPEQSRLRLVSRQALACRAAPRRHLSLRAGDEVLTSELPNPALRNQSTITRDGQRQDSLYQVLFPS